MALNAVRAADVIRWDCPAQAGQSQQHMPQMIPALVRKDNHNLCTVRLDEGAFVWNPATTKAFLVSCDLLDDWLAGALSDSNLITSLQGLTAPLPHRVQPPICFVSMYFDSLPCENKCAYCPLPRRPAQDPSLSPRALVDLVCQIFPAVCDVNISGPDNRQKYAFLTDSSLTGRFAHVSANVNIRNASKIGAAAKKVQVIWGGRVQDFAKQSSTLLNDVAAYIVIDKLDARACDLLLNGISKIPFRSLTLEPDIFSRSIDPLLFSDVVRGLRRKSKFPITGFWERPMLNIGSDPTRRFCNSCSGTSVCLHDTGHVSVCGYLPSTARPFRHTKELKRILHDWHKVLAGCGLPAACRDCYIRGLCQGGCRIAHSRADARVVHQRCELTRNLFLEWVADELRKWNASIDTK